MPWPTVSIIRFAAALALAGQAGAADADCVAACDQATRYGAIAYGPQSGAVGWSTGSGDGRAAEREALKTCRVHAEDCQVVVDFWNSCAAVAADRNIVRYGLADTRSQAEGDARAACEQDGGVQCTIRASACTGP